MVVMRAWLHQVVAFASVGKGDLVEETKCGEELNRAKCGSASYPWGAILGGVPEFLASEILAYSCPLGYLLDQGISWSGRA